MQDSKIKNSSEGVSKLQAVLNQKAVEYTSVTGSYRTWKTDVNLSAPDPANPFTRFDDHIQDYYDSLQYTLYDLNLPETVDRTGEPRTKTTSNSVSIALLASPIECLATLLEGGRQCPGDMMLILSPSWLIKVKSKECEGLHSLYIKKAITFERGGCSYLDEFDTPRRCTYLLNYLTRACTDGQRDDGEKLEQDLDCPMSSSIELCTRVDDKLLTRIWMVDAGVLYPETLAVVYKSAYEYAVPAGANIKVVFLEDKEDIGDKVSSDLQLFLKSDGIKKIGMVVVKPSGPTWHASRGVSFHDIKDYDQIYNAILELAEVIEPANTILIEAFHRPAKHKDPILDKQACRIRVNVCRQPDNTPIASQMVCGIGKKNESINGNNTFPLTLESLLEQWGVNDKECQRLYNTMKQGSEKLLGAIMEDEKNLSWERKGAPNAQTELIGIDYVLSDGGDGLMEPVCIEVNSHDCTKFCQFYENLNPQRRGMTLRPWVKTMIQRSQMFAMKGRTVLVVGAGGLSKRFIFDAYKDYGIQIVLVDQDENSYGATSATVFIQYNFLDHTCDQEHAENIIQKLNELNIEIDGCITFWEDCGPLSATISSKLKLRGAGEQASRIAKKKSSAHRLLQPIPGNNPHFPRPHMYSSKVASIDHVDDIEGALGVVGVPAFLKLEYGASAVGVKLVNNKEECKKEFINIKSNLKSERDHPGIGLGHGNDLFVMEQLTGTEHNVDIVIFNRQLVAAFISDHGPTKKGSFTETTASMPTCLPADKQGQVTIAAYQCCTEIGLVDGVFNVEIMMTAFGPRLIEINAGMGGFYLRDWIIACYGVDLLLASFMISLGIRPVIPQPVPSCHVMGTMCVPSLHRKQLQDINTIKQLQNLIPTGKFRYNQFKSTLEDCGKEGEEEPFCNIAVMAADCNKAKQSLISVCTSLGIHNNQYDLNQYLKLFK